MRTITAPLYGAVYPKRQWKGDRVCLTHAVLLDDDGAMVRVLCGKVQLDSIHDDSTLHTTDEPTCRSCAARLRKIVQAAH